ncbi:unnamed protein product [Pleuronectes platessa]|uniref:Uncharacterized protein n=1 Tax=Pleuronectes platessa TaxID=8262 RepID=A0A9N7UAH2_PLEPL|nr:unnamed protein product [Pleuronectes platessa]
MEPASRRLQPASPARDLPRPQALLLGQNSASHPAQRLEVGPYHLLEGAHCLDELFYIREDSLPLKRPPNRRSRGNLCAPRSSRTPRNRNHHCRTHRSRPGSRRDGRSRTSSRRGRSRPSRQSPRMLKAGACFVHSLTCQPTLPEMSFQELQAICASLYSVNDGLYKRSMRRPLVTPAAQPSPPFTPAAPAVFRAGT